MILQSYITTLWFRFYNFYPRSFACDQHRLIRMIPCMPFDPLLHIGKVFSNLFQMNLS